MKKVLLSMLSVALLIVSNPVSAAVTVTDVTNGAEIRGITTDASASGFAKVAYGDGKFNLHAGFTGLSDPLGDDFYEGWLVRQEPFAFISTGKLIKKDGEYHDMFDSTVDYSDYSLYVLTLEPNDGNDAPADHILEGSTTVVDASVFAKKSAKKVTNLKTVAKAKTKASTPPITIVDVTNGVEYRGVSTPSDASGFGKVAWDGSTFNLHSVFTGLSDPLGDDFYEGWIVRKEPFDVVSTGKLKKAADGSYHNVWSSTSDHSEHSFYVLTLEPNDGNEAPADHILEGPVTLVDASAFAKKKATTVHSDKKLSTRQQGLASRAEARVGNLSAAQKEALLARVIAFQPRVASLNVSNETKEVYTEILEVLVHILSK